MLFRRGGRLALAIWLGLMLAGWLPAAAGAQGRDRVALVVGNGAYRHARALPNPPNDARALGQSLGRLGFDVEVAVDLTRAELEQAARRLGDRSRRARMALFFFAGHGIQADGVNYLIPVDSAVQEIRHLPLETVKLDTVLEQIGGDGRIGIVLLDACRDNPLPRSLTMSGQARSMPANGLAPVQATAQGMLIAYATQPGAVALDGNTRNSPFTSALLRYIEAPDLEIRQVMTRVRVDVRRETGNSQTPWDHSSLENDLFLAGRNSSPSGNAPAPPTLEVQHPPVALPAPKVAVMSPPVVPAKPAPASPPSTPAPAAGNSFRDCPDCPDLVVIRAGRFAMGSDAGDGDELPVHDVSLPRSFAIGRVEVTFDQWDACAASGGCPAIGDDHGWGRGSRPVINVSWDEAQRYLRWLSGRTGNNYRLPSEAEWEYVARAGQAARDVFLVETPNCTNCASVSTRGTLPVDSFPANGFGVSGMLGSVWQWVADCQNRNYRGAPQSGEPWVSGNCSRRGLRGGSWYRSGVNARAANRSFETTGHRGADVGFRVVRDLP